MSAALATSWDAIAIVLGVLAALPAVYLAMLAIAAWRRRAPLAGRGVRFDVIVPAHDEEIGIEATIRSLYAVGYPADDYRVLVIADNCSDRTAELARAAGARVIERHDLARRGKGHALTLAMSASMDDRFADAVVVVDADSVITPNLLGAFAARIAAGTEAMQAEYGVRNPDASWRTRLTVIAFALFHTTRSLGRERLGLSCGLRGNGMCFTHALLRRVPHRATSLVEDVEYGIALGLHGVRIAYVEEARVLGEMPGSGSAARSQRERWERGRSALLREYLAPLVGRAIARRDALLLDLAADLLVPPLTRLVLGSCAGLAVSLYAARHGHSATIVGIWLISFVALVVYVGRGVKLSGLGLRAFVYLAGAPLYAGWKLMLLARPRRAAKPEWIRTTRTGDR